MSWGPLSVFTATHGRLAPAMFFCLRYKLLLTYLRYSGPLYLSCGADLVVRQGVYCGMPLLVGIVVGNFQVRRIDRDMTVGHSEKAADRHDVSLCAAVLVHRDVLRRVWLLAAAIVILYLLARH